MANVLLFLGLQMILWKGSEQAGMKNIVPILDGDEIRLNCGEEGTLDDPKYFKIFPETKYVKSIAIDSCRPPSNGSYAEVLTQLNVNINAIRELVLYPPRTETLIRKFKDTTFIADPKRPRSQHFSGLDLEELKILNRNMPTDFTIDLEFLTVLTNLTRLTIDNCYIIGPFPNTTKLERVELSGGVFYGDFGACQGFKILHITDIHTFDVSIKNCKQLNELKLERMKEAFAARRLLQSLAKTLRNLTVRYCDLIDFPDSYEAFTDPFDIHLHDTEIHDVLTHLDVSHNKLLSSSFISSYNALEFLDISHNELYGELHYLPNLVELRIDHNNFEMYCDPIFFMRAHPTDEYLLQLPLRQLSASGTGMRALCFDSMQLSHLQLLNLTHNNITVLDYRQLFNVSNNHSEVDLRYNPLERVEFSQADYEALKRNDSSVSNWRKLRIRTDARLPCNCSNAWFARAVRERLLAVDGASCDDGTPLEQRRLSYALQGCPAVCEGDTGCSAATIMNNIMNVLGK